MKVSRERYQHGSVRKVPRSQGFAWEFRFYLTAPDGKRKLKVQTFDSLKYPTERDVRKAVEGQLSALNAGTLGGKLAATLGTIIERYMAEDFLTLRHSTQTTNKSLINLHIKPRCLVPAFDGAYFSEREKEALWDRFFTAAPARQRRSVERYNIVKRA
jgi:integrase